jgi:hypothetical protein
MALYLPTWGAFRTQYRVAGAAIMRGMDYFNLGQRGRTAVTVLERKRRLFKEVSEILCSQSYYHCLTPCFFLGPMISQSGVA